MPKAVGIYLIQNIVTNEFYIGQSSNLYGRWVSHRKALQMNNHYNYKLQQVYNEYGADTFKYKSLSIIPNRDPDELNRLEIKYLNDFISQFGQSKCLNIDLNPKKVSRKLNRSKHTYYVYDAFGKFINMFSNTHDTAKALGCKCPHTITKMTNGWTHYEQYKRFRVTKTYKEKIEPLPDTYVIFDEGKVFKFCDSPKMVVEILQVRGGGARTNVFKGALVKKRYRVVRYSDYLSDNHQKIINRPSQGTKVVMLDAKTKKTLKDFSVHFCGIEVFGISSTPKR